MRAAWLVTILVGCGGGSSPPDAGPELIEPFDDCPDLTASCAPGAGCSMADWEHGCSCGCAADGRWTCHPDTIGSSCSTCPVIAADTACTPGDRCAVVGPQLADCQCTCSATGTWSCSGDCPS